MEKTFFFCDDNSQSLLIGVFYEMGIIEYRSKNDTANAHEIRTDGYIYYYGGGLMARMLIFDATVRVGSNGFGVFQAGEKVKDFEQVLDVDMTPKMLMKARKNISSTQRRSAWSLVVTLETLAPPARIELAHTD